MYVGAVFHYRQHRNAVLPLPNHYHALEQGSALPTANHHRRKRGRGLVGGAKFPPLLTVPQHRVLAQKIQDDSKFLTQLAVVIHQDDLLLGTSPVSPCTV